MTQDPHGQPSGSGYVVRGEVVPDDEADATAPNAPTTPMTHFQKVASAFREDRTDPAVPVLALSDREGAPDAPDARDARGEVDGDPTRPEPVIAVRSPDEGSSDHWDEAGETGPKEAAVASPDTPAADATATDTAEAAGPAGTAAGIGATESEAVGRHADPLVAAAPAPGGLRAGGSDRAPSDVTDLTPESLFPDAAEFRNRWQEVQFRFVDDPRGSVTEAADVIAQVTAKLEAAIQDRQRTLRDRWAEGKSTDTESLRETLLMYRAFLDQLTGFR